MQKNNREEICNRLWEISGALHGIGALLQQQDKSASYEHSELFGLGQLLKSLSEEITKLEDQLR